MDLLSPWSRESIKGQPCQSLRGECVCTYVSMCACALDGFWSTLTGEWLSTFICLQPQEDTCTRAHTHISSYHAQKIHKRRLVRQGGCFLKDAAPACMLKLALNVWITHGSSHRGFSSHSLESRECADISVCTHARTKTCPHKQKSLLTTQLLTKYKAVAKDLNFIHRVLQLGRCFLIIEFSFGFFVGKGKTQDASRHRGSERKEEKNGGGIEGGQCPGSQIKAHYLPSASAFQAPARIERRLTLQLSLSVIVQKAQAQDTDSQTDRQTESEKTAQCHSLSRGKLSRLDKWITAGSKWKWMRQPLVMFIQHTVSTPYLKLQECFFDLSRTNDWKTDFEPISLLRSCLLQHLGWAERSDNFLRRKKKGEMILNNLNLHPLKTQKGTCTVLREW